jgi:cardiolipin synthase A/B
VTLRHALAGVVAVGVALLVVFVVATPAPEPPVERLPPLTIGEPAFAATAEAHLDAPVVGGNRATLLFNGDEIFPAKLAAIRAARTSITYAEYFWAEGEVAQAIAEALADRCRAGVAVKVLLDAAGTLTMPREHLRTMRDAGCRVVTFRPLSDWSVRHDNNRNHRRVLVVDGRVGLTGGSGVSEKWTGDGRRDDHWRDTDVRLEGPAVPWLQAAFAENWREATHELLGGPTYFPPTLPEAGDVRLQIVRSSPTAGSYAVYTMVLLAMASARRSILLTNPYFVLDGRMTDTLVSAAQRGVRVVALTPGKIDHALVRSSSRRDFGRLLQAGVEIFEYQPALLHSKTLVVDGVWATVGSTNLDNRSFALNDEVNVAIHDAGLAGQLAAAFERDLQHAQRVDYETWRRRGLRERLLETLVLPLRDIL